VSKPKRLRFNIIPKIRIDGPYGMPSHDYDIYQTIVFIAGGSGASPFMSIMNQLLENPLTLTTSTLSSISSEGKKEEKENLDIDLDMILDQPAVREINFIWMIKTYDCLSWFKEELILAFKNAALSNLIKFKVSIYITQSNSNSSSNSVPSSPPSTVDVASLSSSSSKTLDSLDAPWSLMNGRPNFDVILEKIKKSNPGEDIPISGSISIILI